MKTAAGWVHGYNTPVMADEASGVVVACEGSAEGTDCRRLVPMLAQTKANLQAISVTWTSGERPPIFSADAGYCPKANLAEPAWRSLDAYVRPGVSAISAVRTRQQVRRSPHGARRCA